MTINEHILELKYRLKIGILVVVFLMGVGYANADRIFKVLVLPLENVFASHNIQREMMFTSLTEGFTTKVKISIFFGMLFGMPVLLWQFYRFVAPGLLKAEKRAFLPYITLAPTLFYVGTAVVYYMVMPMAWEFFLSFEGDFTGSINVVLHTRIEDYVGLISSMIIAFGIAFQMPLILVLLVQIGMLTPLELENARRYAIVMIFLAAAILTPPDVMSQIALGSMLMVLYEIAIFIAKMVRKNA